MGNANVWAPETKISGNMLSVPQSFTLTANQVQVEITSFKYAVGTGALEVFKNGLLLDPETDYVEVNESQINLLVSVAANDKLVVIGKVGISGEINFDFGDVTVIETQPTQYGDATETVFTAPADEQVAADHMLVVVGGGYFAKPTIDYTINSEGNVVFTSAPDDGVSIDIRYFKPVTVDSDKLSPEQLGSYTALRVSNIASLRTTTAYFDGQDFNVISHTEGGKGGGKFYYDASDETSIDNNGTVIVNDEGQRFKRVIESSLLPAEAFGLTGVDSITNLQRFSDYCEANNLVADFSGLTQLNVKGTWYWGNCNMKFGKCVIKVVSDSNFTHEGTATRNNAGAILTKSAALAGYGLSTVDIDVDHLYISMSRVSAANSMICPYLLENVSKLNTDFIVVITPDGETAGKTPIDIYSGVQNVSVNNVYIYSRGGAGAGGFWIRNSNLSRPTKNINIPNIFIDHEGADEALAIFNFVGAADLSDINIGKVTTINRGNGLGVSVMNKFGYDADMYKNISIGEVHHTMYSSGGAPFGFKTENCKPFVGKVTVDIKDVSGAGNVVYGVRDVGTGFAYTVELPDVTVTLDTVNPSSSMFAVGGTNLICGKLKVTSENGSFQNIVQTIEEIKEADINASYANMAVRNTRRVKGIVYGKMEGVGQFEGKHYIDTDDKNNAVWFAHSSSTREPTEPLVYKGEQFISGAGTINKAISVDATWTNPISTKISYIRENPDNVTVTPDNVANSFELVDYDVVANNANVYERVLKTTVVPTDATRSGSFINTDFQDATSKVNVYNKYRGKTEYDLSTNSLVYASGSNPTDTWRRSTDTTVIYTPV